MRAGVSLLLSSICRCPSTVPAWSIAASSHTGLPPARRDPRSTLPTTATALRRPASSRGSPLACRNAQIAASEASPSSRLSSRITVVKCGTTAALLKGSTAKPRVRRSPRDASAIHSVIAVIDFAPASTLAAAAGTIATSGKCRPRRLRGSGRAARNRARRTASGSGCGDAVRASCSSPPGMGEDGDAGTVFGCGHADSTPT